MTALALPTCGPNPSKFTMTRSTVVGVAASMFTLQQQGQISQGQGRVLVAEWPILLPEERRQWQAWLARIDGRAGTFLMGDPAMSAPSGAATGTPVVDIPALSLTTSGSTASGLTLPFSSTAGVRIGQSVAGTNVTPGSVVTGFVADTSVTLNYPIAGTVGSSATIVVTGMAGSFLYTRGWTHGVTGILLAGDYIQVGTTLYDVCADCNSDSNGYSVIPVWPRVRQPAPADGVSIITSGCVGIFRLDGPTGITITPPSTGALSISAHEVIS